jgi:hypothetical protein
MIALRHLLASLALVAAAHGAVDAGQILTPASAAGDWGPLIGALAAKGPVQASFTEYRYFPFRREPTILKGVLRISPVHGLSLQYTDPEPSILIADATGLIMRDKTGRSRERPAGSREGGAIASLLPILRFDFTALFPLFNIRATRGAASWAFEFTPREPGAAGSLGVITVAGSGTDVSRLEFKRSISQRVEIDVADTKSGVAFTPDELARFFR